ncbi:MAG: Hsp70 family protein [Spirochaetia bacterium]|nr:Hsp70 family protein [Spirochaetia bacterium]
MAEKRIGIKLADGEFYPILPENRPARKRLIVTTVKDDQASVQIDLYRGEAARVTGDDYIGSLLITSIEPRPAGEPDIRLDVSLDAAGELAATATDESSGVSRSLRVSLASLPPEEHFEVPDFEFEELAESPLSGGGDGPDFNPFEAETAALTGAGLEVEDASLLGKAELARGVKGGRRFPWIVIPIALAAVGLVVLVLFLLRGCPAGTTVAPEPVAAVEAKPAPAPAPAPAEAKPATPAPAPVEAKPAATPAPAPTAPKPATPAAKTPGVNYKIRWGDTLWDLAYAYYRNPWLYPKIAAANSIKNPDLIISGTTIWIPAK